MGAEESSGTDNLDFPGLIASARTWEIEVNSVGNGSVEVRSRP